MKDSTSATASTWVTSVYMPEGSNRPDHNRPISGLPEAEQEQAPATIAEIVARANRQQSRQSL